MARVKRRTGTLDPDGPGAGGLETDGLEGALVDEPRGDLPGLGVPDDNEVIEAIIHASRAMVGIAIRSLTECGESVTLPQYRTLVVLADGGPRRLADLADALGVSPSTATRMCDRLVRKGLITRARDELDRREVNLEVTPAGRTTVLGVINRRPSDSSPPPPPTPLSSTGCRAGTSRGSPPRLDDLGLPDALGLAELTDAQGG